MSNFINVYGYNENCPEIFNVDTSNIDDVVIFIVDALTYKRYVEIKMCSDIFKKNQLISLINKKYCLQKTYHKYLINKFFIPELSLIISDFLFGDDDLLKRIKITECISILCKNCNVMHYMPIPKDVISPWNNNLPIPNF